MRMEDLIMKHAGMRITMACNLNCARCGVYAPYFKATASHLPFDCLKAGLTRFFEIVNYTKKFTIIGGEPLLHPDLAPFMELFQQYTEQVGIIEIISNGSVLPSKQLICAAERLGDKVYFLIDNYGENLSNKLAEIDCLLSEAKIDHIIRENHQKASHCNGWVDYGDLRKKKLYSKDAVEKLYAKCAHPQKFQFCFTISEGLMYPCAPYEICRKLGTISGDYREYIDLFDETLTVEEQRQKIRNIYAGKSLSACAYCNGMCDDSERYTPAVQLTAEEMRCVKDGARSYDEVLEMLHREPDKEG